MRGMCVLGALAVGLSAMLQSTVPVQALTYNHVCPGGTASWQGTQDGPSAPVVVTGDAQITCPTPQVTITAGSTEHRVTSSYTPPQNGQPCFEYENSDVAIGPVVNAQRQVSWYNPGQGVITETIPDEPFAGIPGYIPSQASVLFASLIMGSANMTLHYELVGTWSTLTQSCQGNWTIPANGGKDYGFPIAAVTRRGHLTYVTPPTINVEQLVSMASLQFKQVYSGGQVASTPPAVGQIVHYPSCFSEQSASVPLTVGFSIRDPQPGTGAVLVVNYVVTATTNQVWWDFSEPENPVTVQERVDPSSPCAVQHTYTHVSADAYGSSHIHHPPPGVAWAFGDAGPAADMEAVEAWQHIHFSLTAYYQEPDGSQLAQVIPVNNGADDYWLAARPEWVRVYQIEGIPYTP